MYRFTCHYCGKKLSYRMEQLGKRIKCPKCQGVLQCGMQGKVTTDEASQKGERRALSDYEKKQWLVASVLVVAALFMIWWQFF
jgi:phage FluMu protein Com